jgi:PAT family beta-lactamase induction signal transducer AmpG
MPRSPFIKPHYVFFMAFASGSSQGFCSVAMPFLLAKHGFSVAAIGSMIAIAVSANLLRFVWGPLVDLSFSLKKWYWFSIFAMCASLLLVCNLPFTVEGKTVLTIALLVSQIAATLVMLPISGFMAHSIPHHLKGSAGGWYQAGNLGGTGFGGGVGLWVATHYGVSVAGLVLCVAAVAFASIMFIVTDVPADKKKKLSAQAVAIGKDVFALVKVPVALFTLILICTPIGCGSASNLWSAIAVEWHVDADTVSLTTGIVAGLVGALGCVVGGFFVDKAGVWTGFFGSGIICAVVTVVMALMPQDPVVFIAGVLTYAFGLGLINAAFTAVILMAIGKRNAATKFSLLISFGNLPVVYMTAADGWMHDQFNSKWMLIGEAAIGVLFVVIGLFVVRQMKSKNLLVHSME